MALVRDPEIAALAATTRRLTSQALALSQSIQATVEELQSFRGGLSRPDRRRRDTPYPGQDRRRG